jgi:hypothetical protein
MKRSKQYLDEWIRPLTADDRGLELGDKLAGFIDRLRSESNFAGPAPQELAGRLAAEARSVAHDAPASVSLPPARKSRKRAMIATFLSTLLGKLAVAGVALAATTGGLAVTGSLPDPAQEWASGALSNLGIEIPAASDVDLSEVEDVDVPELHASDEDVIGTADDADEATEEVEDETEGVDDDETDDVDDDELTEDVDDGDTDDVADVDEAENDDVDDEQADEDTEDDD